MIRTEKMRIAALAFASTMITVGWGATSASAAPQEYCHSHYVTGKQASGAKLSKAKQRARSKWSNKAESVFGSRGGNWQIARHKQYLCGRAGLYYCQAKAVPCMSRGPSSGGSQKPIN